MAQYRLDIFLGFGEGNITVNGVTPLPYYEEGSNLTVAVALGTGFSSIEWFETLSSTPISTATSFVYVMPSSDNWLRGVMNGLSAPVNGYALKYYVEYGSIEGACKRLEIYKDGYVGASSEIKVSEVEYGFGNTGDDPLKTIVGSYLDFHIVGGVNDYTEFIEGGNRTWQVKYYEDKVDTIPFFVGYISPDFITIQDYSGNQSQQFTAIDGLKGLDSVRANTTWIDNLAYYAIIGALNQDFTNKRDVNLYADIHEIRMNDTLDLFTQFLTSSNCLFTDGKDIEFNDGLKVVNERLFLKDVIERIVNPFLCKVFLWRNEFWVVRIDSLLKPSYTTFKYNNATSPLTGNTVTNGLDISCIINNPERTARRVFTEFTAILNMGVLDPSSQGAIIEAITSIDNWFIGGLSSPFAGKYKLLGWQYINAIPVNQVTTTPVGPTALVQYVPANESAKIWVTSSTAGLADPNLAAIRLNTTTSNQPFVIAQETANKISFNFEFMLLAVSPGTGTLANYEVTFSLRVGDYYLDQVDPTTFAFSLTPSVISIDAPNINVFNKFSIANILVPSDGEVEFTFYQLICTGGTANQFTVEYRKLKLSIEENDALVLSEIATKAITSETFSNVHPDYQTYMGDAETNNSSSALKLNLAGFPVSEEWSRDGIESLPLMDLLVQDLANLKGRSNLRILGTVERQEIKPYQSVEYNGKLYMIISIKLDTYRNRWQCELFELGIVPTT